MLGLILAAAAMGQVDVGSYFGYGETIYVQAEPYYEVEDEYYVEPEDYSSYPVCDFSDGGDPGDVPIPGAVFGNGGVVTLIITEPGEGFYAVNLNMYPNPHTTGGLITVSGSIVVTIHDQDANPALEYTMPVFAIFLSPRTIWNWNSGLFGGIPPGCYMTARFTGSGFGSAPSYWTCPGVYESITIH